jgi:demethoxyubiquinone hydroxylase (CLK1/Coq7/Cat5 family)
MARFHVQHADGRLESGARAFIALWELLPGWRWLARLGRLPGMTTLMEWAYRGFLRVRPAFQALARRWDWQPAAAGASALPHELLRELRTDHAGETGAVMIYRGVLAATRDPALRTFAQHHLDTERRHLTQIEQLIPERERSRLLPLWRVSGWLTGALPACAGPTAVYATIQAVETFVDRHYADQVRLIDTLLSAQPGVEPSEPRAAMARELQNLRAVLEQCRLDEVSHRDDAAQHWDGHASAWLRLWQSMVGHGSAWAVALCRRL